MLHTVIFLQQLREGTVAAAETPITRADPTKKNTISTNKNDPAVAPEEDSCPVAPKNEHRAAAEQLQCGLYLAESTIPGAGLGIFTAVDKEPGETVGYGDVCIPMVGE